MLKTYYLQPKATQYYQSIIQLKNIFKNRLIKISSIIICLKFSNTYCASNFILFA